MKIFVHYDGKTWSSPELTGVDMEALVATMYEDLDRKNKFKLGLENGGYLLLPAEASQRAAIEIVP